jgi:hypothetical protein
MGCALLHPSYELPNRGMGGAQRNPWRCPGKPIWFLKSLNLTQRRNDRKGNYLKFFDFFLACLAAWREKTVFTKLSILMNW